MRKAGITITLFAGLLVCTLCPAQKMPLDHSVYDGWQSIAGTTLSADGRILTYVVNPQQGDSELFIRETSMGGREISIPRGGTATISRDGLWAFSTIKAPYAVTREAKIKKTKADDMPKDSLAIIDLRTFEVTKVEGASGMKYPVAGPSRVAYMLSIDKAAAETDKAKKPEKEKVLIVYENASGAVDTLRNVDKYAFSKDGGKLAVVFKKDKKDSLSNDEVVLYKNLRAEGGHLLHEKVRLASGHKFYSLPKFDRTGDKLAWLASMDSTATGGKHCSVYLYERTTSGRGRNAVDIDNIKELIPQEWETEDGLCVTENAAPVFSRLSDRLFLGIAECEPPKDTTIVDFETAQLDIWNYDIYLTPPMQKAQAARLKTATCRSVINLNNPHKLVPIAESVQESVRLLDGGEGEWALVTDPRPYQISSTWDSNDLVDVYLVSLADGARYPLACPLNGSIQVSPAGKYMTWFSNDDLGWHVYDIANDIDVNVTDQVRAVFYDEEDDHPMTPPAVDRPHWLENDAAFIISDKYDIWKFTPDGSEAICLTAGEGRKNNLQLSYLSIKRDPDFTSFESEAGISEAINPKELIYLSAFDRKTKENGIATVSLKGGGIKELTLAPKTFSGISSTAGKTVFLEGDLQHPMDVYLTSGGLEQAVQISHINPQQEDYIWPEAQLVHWNAYDGTSLDGILLTPDNLYPSEKYPMIIYFYEKNSETLFNYRAPAPSRSTVNIPYFVSNGYVVFIPDIVYEDGHPGQSAYNCICSGAEAMCEQFEFIDRDHMGIQGQSWGGYQTAYLVTQTDMFAAAGAGAPVGNMTSAYGGIRWESGMVRAMQYEHGQSRIGTSLWDRGGLDLYIENSPVFHVENVTTPTLIMHNDNDGAVPWYQGIEFFMSLRRFGHPAWLLEYNNEAHNLAERRNAKDLSVRLQQFFDHYLKGAPMPAWMATGVPTARKGEYFGFEYVD